MARDHAPAALAAGACRAGSDWHADPTSAPRATTSGRCFAGGKARKVARRSRAVLAFIDLVKGRLPPAADAREAAHGLALHARSDVVLPHPHVEADASSATDAAAPDSKDPAKEPDSKARADEAVRGEEGGFELMDLNDYCGEQAPSSRPSGVLVFGIGTMLVGKYFGDELEPAPRRDHDGQQARARSDVHARPMREAQLENDALQKRSTRYEGVHVRAARSSCSIPSGSASNQYFAVVSAVRDPLRQAGRANARARGPGLPALSPTREPDIARYLEASIRRPRRAWRSQPVASASTRSRSVSIRAPTRAGVGRVESTRVPMTLSGKSALLQ
jgi:hypothetical protein